MSKILAVVWGLLAIALLVVTPESLFAVFGCVVMFVFCTYLHIKKMWKEEDISES